MHSVDRTVLRMCGEHLTSPSAGVFGSGSSPRVRGTQRHQLRRTLRQSKCEHVSCGAVKWRRGDSQLESNRYSNSLYVLWQTPNDTNVVQGGYIEVQYQAAGATGWTEWGRCDSSVNSLFIAGVNVGSQYDVQIRAVNCAGVPSAWVQASPETISTTYSPFSYNGVPVAPTGTLTAQSTSSCAQITIAPFTPFVYPELCTPNPSVLTACGFFKPRRDSSQTPGSTQ